MHSQETRELDSAFRREEIWRKLEYQMTPVKKCETRDFQISSWKWSWMKLLYQTFLQIWAKLWLKLVRTKSKLEQNCDSVWKGNVGWSEAGDQSCSALEQNWAEQFVPALPGPPRSSDLPWTPEVFEDTSGEMQEGCKTQEDGNSQTTAFIYFFPTKPHKLKLLKSARSHYNVLYRVSHSLAVLSTLLLVSATINPQMLTTTQFWSREASNSHPDLILGS